MARPRLAIVVGAGMAGLMAAQRLNEAGWRVMVLEKSRGVGGRMATRRVAGAVLDHGAQHINAVGDAFRAQIEHLAQMDVARIWARGFPGVGSMTAVPEGPARHIGTAGMTGIARALARGLEIVRGQAATAVVREGERWRVETADGREATGDAVILTPPVPQTLALLEASAIALPDAAHELMEAVRYDPCLTALAVLDKRSAVPAPGGLMGDGDPIGWLADNVLKGVSPGPGAALTIHASPAWSRANLERDPGDCAHELLTAAAEWTGRGKLVALQGHRWRYSLAHAPEGAPACLPLDVGPAPLVVAGDGLGGGRVEGAAVSGVAAAAHVLNNA